ncbi:MAG: PaaX family transcriptional regulator C-terminal domain-containing protein [Ilumatobacteraceae bacterium]
MDVEVERDPWWPLARPLGARSIVASLLLGMHPPRTSGARLVWWCGQFGISENATRVALSRMVDRGELVSADGNYELSGRVAARQAAQDWARSPAYRDWDGRWVIHVVDSAARSAGERTALRSAASAARLAELREGVWTRPANLPETATPPDANSVLASQTLRWLAVPERTPDVSTLFALEDWSQRARVLVDATSASTAAIRDGTSARALAQAFVAGAALLQHLRRDPFLPTDLTPVDWPGELARATYTDFQAVFPPAVAAAFHER